MEEKVRGIVLFGTNFGEGDKILNIFTLEKGVLSAKIKGVKKAGAKLKFAAEPFCFAEFIIMRSGERRTVINASLIDSFYPLREDLTKFFCGGAALDFIRKFCKEEIISPKLFLGLTDTLKKLSYTSFDPKSTLAEFFINALEISGYGLNLEGCFNCGTDLSGRVFFDSGIGGFLCEKCFSGSGREINLSTYTALKNLSHGKEEKELSVKALRLIDYYITVKTDETIKPLKELLA